MNRIISFLFLLLSFSTSFAGTLIYDGTSSPIMHNMDKNEAGLVALAGMGKVTVESLGNGNYRLTVTAAKKTLISDVIFKPKVVNNSTITFDYKMPNGTTTKITFTPELLNIGTSSMEFALLKKESFESMKQKLQGKRTATNSSTKKNSTRKSTAANSNTKKNSTRKNTAANSNTKKNSIVAKPASKHVIKPEQRKSNTDFPKVKYAVDHINLQGSSHSGIVTKSVWDTKPTINNGKPYRRLQLAVTYTSPDKRGLLCYTYFTDENGDILSFGAIPASLEKYHTRSNTVLRTMLKTFSDATNSSYAESFPLDLVKYLKGKPTKIICVMEFFNHDGKMIGRAESAPYSL